MRGTWCMGCYCVCVRMIGCASSESLNDFGFAENLLLSGEGPVYVRIMYVYVYVCVCVYIYIYRFIRIDFL